MERKAVFFDADGTVSHLIKGVPASAEAAIHALQDKGHLAFLCTGRSRALVDEPLERIGFDGIIASAGAYLEKDGIVLYNQELSCQDAKKVLHILRDCGLVPVMEGREYMYYDPEEYTSEVDWYAEDITRILGRKFKKIRGNEDRLFINKISAKAIAGCDANRAIEELKPWFHAVVHESDGFAGGTIEFVPTGYSKAVGIAVACRLWNIAKEDTICFGDSNNDIEMFEYVHTKVAMGNASPKLIEMADYVTGDMFHFGIRNGLRHLGLID